MNTPRPDPSKLTSAQLSHYLAQTKWATPGIKFLRSHFLGYDADSDTYRYLVLYMLYGYTIGIVDVKETVDVRFNAIDRERAFHGTDLQIAEEEFDIRTGVHADIKMVAKRRLGQ